MIGELSNANEKLKGQLEERSRKRHSTQGTQTEVEKKRSREEKNDEMLMETTLVCNIPEHHELEDLVHAYQEQLENLKAYVREIDDEDEEKETATSSTLEDNLAVLEKRAEFEALDLAINERRQQLVNLEMAKNRRMRELAADQDSESNTESEMMLMVN